jgi:hypothetical protein
LSGRDQASHGERGEDSVRDLQRFVAQAEAKRRIPARVDFDDRLTPHDARTTRRKAAQDTGTRRDHRLTI